MGASGDCQWVKWKQEEMLTLIRFSLSYWKKIKRESKTLTKAVSNMSTEGNEREEAEVQWVLWLKNNPMLLLNVTLHLDCILHEKPDWLLLCHQHYYRHMAFAAERLGAPSRWMHSFIWIALGLGWSSSRCQDDLTPCLGSCDRCWPQRLTCGGDAIELVWGVGLWHRNEKWCNQLVCETANRASCGCCSHRPPIHCFNWHKWDPDSLYTLQ